MAGQLRARGEEGRLVRSPDSWEGEGWLWGCVLCALLRLGYQLLEPEGLDDSI